MQPGGQNPFQLGNKNQLFGLRPNTDSEMQVSQNQPFGSRTTTTQITLPSSQPMFGVMAGGSHGFGSPPTFSTPIATMANSREPVSTGKQVQSSSTHPVFGSAFQSQTMAGLSGNSENLKPRSTFSFTGSPLNQNRPTMFSNQIGFGGQQQQQQPVRPLFPGAFTSTTIPNTLPRLGGTFQQSSLHHISSKPKNDVEVEHMVHPPSTAPSTSSLFGQKFGTVTSSTNIFGGTSKDSSNQGDRHSPAAPQFVTNTTDGIPKKDSTRESNQRESPVHHGGPPSHDGTPSKSTSVVEDQKKSVKTFSKQRESVYKPLIQRKNVLFARAMAGVGRGDRPRVRLPSKDDRPSGMLFPSISLDHTGHYIVQIHIISMISHYVFKNLKLI